MAVHTEIPESAGRFALPALVHRDEDRIVRRVCVHASGPLTEMIGVTLIARLGIE
jgi:hypothetical protein